MTYIQHLAKDLHCRFGNDLSRVAVVFPNKRASLFLNEELARLSDSKPLWAPTYITISDLFRSLSSLQVADQILLVCRLYDVYCRVTGYCEESLDHFYNWGLLLLADFDDLDKNMAPADKVFSIVSDLHELDSAEYLTETQRETLKLFFQNFTDSKHTQMKDKFLHMWSKLYAIYTHFREELRSDNIAYEGMLYREVAESEHLNFEYDTYCIVGFNMLQQVEQNLFMKLKNTRATGTQPKVLFYWDYDEYYLSQNHEAGHFIRQYLPMLGSVDMGKDVHSSFIATKKTKSGPCITYLSATSENLQARYVHDWLLENDRWKCGARTAIVMSDEKLLQTIIRSIPKEVTKVNITTGYPLVQSPVVSLMQLLIELQAVGRIIGTDKFRLKYVNRVLRHPYSHYIDERCPELYRSINGKSKSYHPSRSVLSVSHIFDDIDTISAPGYECLTVNSKLTIWLQQIVKTIAQNKNLEGDLEQESLFRTYTILQRLFRLITSGILDVDTVTYRRLLMQIINATTIPYHGEPVEGIQIMGILETRCLDFDHILLLSCNEGNIPKGVNDTSFIPHSVRKAYGMTTVEHKVGIYSYYFHRLLQRCGDVSITYNSSTEGMNTGEMSRFMLQLLVDDRLSIARRNLTVRQPSNQKFRSVIEKDEAIIQKLQVLFGITDDPDPSAKHKRHAVSPSSLGKYLRCQLRYYYEYVVGLKEQESDDVEDMDNRVFGNIFHDAAEKLYAELSNNSSMQLTKSVLESTLKDTSKLLRIINASFAKNLFNIDENSHDRYHPELNGLQIINQRVILRLLEDLIRYDIQHAPITILGLEKSVYTDLILSDGKTTVHIGGKIDRLDMIRKVEPGKTTNQIRVIDYKTGSRDVDSLASVEDIFSPNNIQKHSDYFLQAMLYSIIVQNDISLNPGHSPVAPALLFIQKMRKQNYNPVLVINKENIYDIHNVEEEYTQHLIRLLEEILDPTVPFSPTIISRNCESCPFATMCAL